MPTLGLTSQQELVGLLQKTKLIQAELHNVQTRLNDVYEKSCAAGFEPNIPGADWRNTKNYWDHQQQAINQIRQRLDLCHRVLSSKLGVQFNSNSTTRNLLEEDPAQALVAHLSNPLVQASVIQMVVNEIEDLSKIQMFSQLEPESS